MRALVIMNDFRARLKRTGATAFSFERALGLGAFAALATLVAALIVMRAPGIGTADSHRGEGSLDNPAAVALADVGGPASDAACAALQHEMMSSMGAPRQYTDPSEGDKSDRDDAIATVARFVDRRNEVEPEPAPKVRHVRANLERLRVNGG
jgi:hypothetical protein